MLRLVNDSYLVRSVRKLLSSKNCSCKQITSSLQFNPRYIKTYALSFAAVTPSNIRVEPLNLSYDFYKSTKDPFVSSSPIVIMHGLLGSKTNWRSLCKDINRAAGHSPELVEKLVIVDISPISTADAIDADIPKYMEAMLSCLKEIPIRTPLPQARNLANKLMSAAVPNIATRQFLLTNLMESNNEIKWRCNLEVLLKKFKESVREFPSTPGQYDGKTLFICGSLSRYVPETDHEKIRKIFPNSKFTYIEGAGHWVHSEKPKEFTRVLLEFIQN